MITRCLFWYHDGGKSCETCECAKVVARDFYALRSNPRAYKPPPQPICHIAGCASLARRRGFCDTHYEVFQRLTEAADSEFKKKSQDVRVQR
jgi:hypothetical protein